MTHSQYCQHINWKGLLSLVLFSTLYNIFLPQGANQQWVTGHSDRLSHYGWSGPHYSIGGIKTSWSTTYLGKHPQASITMYVVILHLWYSVVFLVIIAMGVVEVLYNSDYAFSERLYGELDVEICCVRLHQPLHQLVQLPQPYMWNKIPRRSFQGLMCINEVQCHHYEHIIVY